LGTLIRGTVTEVETNQSPGYVIDQSPPAGEMVRPGTSVNLVISASPTVQVPDLRGMKEQQARQYIENMHGLLKLGTVTPQFTNDCNIPVDKVTEQSLPPHQKVRVGLEINLVVLQNPKCIIK
jgi:beta-lactam-binding protein with PASTA domain